MPTHAKRAAAPVLLVLLPILVKLPLLLGWLRADPMLLYSGLQHGVVPGPLGGSYPTIDPNIAFTSATLGHRAALDLLAGHMPWWNPFEAVGTPLAGEMQSAALFPLTLLLAVPGGQVFEHIALQIIAGLATYGLLRRLGLAALAAFAGAVAFAFNGVFAWLGNAVVNPVAFLPMLLLGIEAAASAARERRSGGGAWIGVALAGSLYAGFPEVAYLDGLLAAAWTLTRLGGLNAGVRVAFLRKVALGAAAGLLAAAPILIAFADYLPAADVGSHSPAGLLGTHMDPAFLSLIVLPYLLRGIFSAPGNAEFWGNVGGYGGCVLLALAIAGLLGRRRLGLRLMLAAWVAAALGLTFGAPGLYWLARLVPGLAQTALYRYLPASWIMALCVLAALALDDLMRGARGWRIATGVLLLLGAIAVSLGLDPPPRLTLSDHVSRGSVAVAATCVLAVAALALWRGLAPAQRAVGLTGVLLVETLVCFGLPILSTPRAGSVELAAIDFLQTHLGLQRFVTLGPIAPNYGAYFGVASINHNDLPVPRAWTAYVHDHLDANAQPIIFNGDARADPAGPSATAALLANRAAYAAIGVRYVVAPLERELSGLREVFRDRVLRIVELDGTAPYVSAAGCRLDVPSRTHVVASCEAPATLVRLELAMPGWRATVAGQPAEIVTSGRIFQSVRLPAGESDVRFAFEPPHMWVGFVALAVGLLLLAQQASPSPQPSPGRRERVRGVVSLSGLRERAGERDF